MFAGLEPYKLSGVTVMDHKLHGCSCYGIVLVLEHIRD